MLLSLKPKSILQLTITGFLVVAGILVLTLLITAKKLNELSDQSQQVISRTVKTIQFSKTLTEQASAMERNALQFRIVRDEEILEVYSNRRNIFTDAARNLVSLNLGQEMDVLIDSLVNREISVYEGLFNAESEPVDEDEMQDPGLLDITSKISVIANEWAELQLEYIRQQTTNTQNLLALQAAFLVGIALLLAGIFTVLITRPLLQIEKAITVLGSGQYDESIRISGPRDLVNLGNLLDWLRKRLGKLEQYRSSFFRHISHELKTPLAAIRESASLLYDGVAGELTREQKEIIHIQSKNCQRLQVLIDDLLRYNSDNFSVIQPKFNPVRLDSIVKKVTACHELIIRTCGIGIECKLASLIVMGDGEQFRVIIDNLLINAIRYAPAGSTIQINLQQNEDQVIFDICDAGPGIPVHEREKIFSPFYQGEQRGKDFLKGSGLGLAIARDYIAANKGTIELCESKKGAHFRLCFQAANRESK